jgi:hypothetical protein
LVVVGSRISHHGDELANARDDAATRSTLAFDSSATAEAEYRDLTDLSYALAGTLGDGSQSDNIDDAGKLVQVFDELDRVVGTPAKVLIFSPGASPP